jgi:DNA repair exonuclease SbcCD nuclease subunit
MSRLVAIADAHLGRAHYQAVDAGGLNQREVDFAASWHRAVEAALGLDPDAVLVLGDLFDAPRPTYRAFREGARGLRTLAAAGVPTLAISGNHDTPRLRESGSPYAVLADAFGDPTCASSTGAATSRSTCCPGCGSTPCPSAPTTWSSRSRSPTPPPPAPATT